MDLLRPALRSDAASVPTRARCTSVSGASRKTLRRPPIPYGRSLRSVAARLLDQIADGAAVDRGEPLGKRVGEGERLEQLHRPLRRPVGDRVPRDVAPGTDGPGQ